MRARSAANCGLCIALLLSGPACFYSSAPRGWLPDAQGSMTSAHGSWISVVHWSGARIEGELLVATSDTIHILPPSLGWTAVPIADATSATLTAYRMPLGPIVGWSVAGTLATISHGYFLMFTAPVWIITGTAGAAAASRAPRIRSLSPDTLRFFARFPHGLPPHVDRASIRGKP
jgi:hypothetical protein